MPINARSKQVIQQAMQKDINDLKTDMDASSGPIKDIAITPQATQLAVTESTVAYASKLLSLANAGELIPADLDAYGADFGVFRGLGSFARGTVLFERGTAPVTDITIPASSQVSVGGTVLTYYVEAPVTMYASLAPTYYNPARNKWGIPARVVASNPGTSYNVSAGRIRTLNSSISGIDSVYNSSDITGGIDIPNNVTYAQKIANVLGGTDRSSTPGTQGEIFRNFPQIQAVSIIQGNDALITRIGSGIPRDIYLTGATSQQYNDSYTYNGGAVSVTLNKQPVLSIIGVFNQGTGSTYTEGTDFTFSKDMGPYQGSTMATDTLEIPLTTTIASGTNLKIVYAVNATIQSIQDYYDTESHMILGVDTLVKEGIPVPIYMTIRMTTLPGYALQDVRDAVSQALLTLLNTGIFGDGVTELTPDIVRTAILNNVSGVGTLLFTRFSRGIQAGVITTIILAKNEYTEFDSSTLLWA